MSKFLSMAVMCSMAFSATALAQGVMIEEEDIETVEVDVEVEETPIADPPPPPAIDAVPPPKVAADDMSAVYAGDEPEDGRTFLDGLSWQLMASGFYFFNGYRVSGVYNDILPQQGERFSYPYTNYMGFGLNFAGGMVSYEGEKFGVTVDLRFGTAAPALTPLSPIKQGYVSYLPTDRLSIDFGFFDTIYGAEVADEWENANYTRGALYFLRQPFNHLGVRMGAELSDTVGFTLMLTNGGVLGGTPVDDNQVPAVGWQFAFAPGDVVGLYIGGNHAPSGSNGNRDWESFFDLVLSVNVEWFTLLINGDYQVNPNGVNPDTGATNQMIFQYGGSIAFIFDVTDQFGIGLRGEHLSGNSNYRNFGDPVDSTYGFLWTGTLTFRYKPVEYLVLSLEGRIEGAGEDIYFSRSSPEVDGVIEPDKKIFGAVILGVSAYIGN